MYGSPLTDATTTESSERSTVSVLFACPPVRRRGRRFADGPRRSTSSAEAGRRPSSGCTAACRTRAGWYAGASARAARPATSRYRASIARVRQMPRRAVGRSSGHAPALVHERGEAGRTALADDERGRLPEHDAVRRRAGGGRSAPRSRRGSCRLGSRAAVRRLRGVVAGQVEVVAWLERRHVARVAAEVLAPSRRGADRARARSHRRRRRARREAAHRRDPVRRRDHLGDRQRDDLARRAVDPVAPVLRDRSAPARRRTAPTGTVRAARSGSAVPRARAPRPLRAAARALRDRLRATPAARSNRSRR